MADKYTLGLADYVVVGASLLIATGIGISFKFLGGGQKNANDYLMAGRDMSKLPVILSITVTCLSATTMIGTPAEIYRYGFAKILQPVATLTGTVVAAYVFVPVYFECQVSTVHEFLEIRYGKKMRYAVSAFFIIQMVSYMAFSLYGPVLALSAVTDLSPEMSIIIIGVVCTFYCMVGGLKAVLWTDVFQAILMYSFVIILFVQGITEAGGVGEIFHKSFEGQRLDIWNFSPDMTVRYTVWGVFARGIMKGLALYGTSQVEVQRILSMRNIERAKSSLLWSSVTSLVLTSMCFLSGLIMYGIFSTCDPLKDARHTGIKKYDQMVPYYIVSRFSSFPGLTGLCVSGIFSGSLSSLSSAINSASTVTVIDFIQPLLSKFQITEKKTVIIAKLISLFFGVLCIGVTFSLTKVDSLMAAASTLIGITEGPMVAIFFIAVLTRKCDERCALIGLLSGMAASSWVGYGSLFSGYRPPTLPLSTSGCLSQESSLLNSTILCPSNSSCLSSVSPYTQMNSETFILYKISHNWVPMIGFCSSILFSALAIMITGSKNVITADSKCLAPIARLRKEQESSEKNGLEHKNIIPMKINKN